MQTLVTVNKLGLDLGTSLNASSTKLVSFGIARGEIKAVYNKCSVLKQPSFTEVINGTTNQVAPKAAVVRNNYASFLLSSRQPNLEQTVPIHKEYWHPRILTDLARGIGVPLRINNSTIAGNYRRYAWVLIDVDLVDVGHLVAKCKSVIEKRDVVPSNMAGFNQEINITAPPTSPDIGVAPTRTDFDIEVGKSVPITSESVRTTSNHTTVPRQITSWANAFGDSYEELGDDADDIVEDEWPPLQG
ncbi:hypothetical protein FNV43_RR24822 [Rhamnella rubrinervis]|uniref:DUF4283 domain-containing protein n=1 Tax=Rhamnella rubrinervis TaxID=2594499 RepID=A0A8K0GPH6_9ROSA|nr:hypothetical protein FNV43_RR24822 [Rhamnella rubrinervis]